MKAGMTRRTFVKGSLALSLPFFFPGSTRSGVDRQGEAGARIVEVQGPLEGSLKQLLESLGGISRFVKPGDTVLIKPNMSFPNPPQNAVTTNPRLVAALLEHCLNAGAKKILVVDHPMRSERLCLEWTGMKEVCKGIREVHLFGASQENMYKKISLARSKVLKTTKLLRAVLKADVQINLPQMKSHAATTVSLGTKGNMGLIWDRASFHGRMDLNEAIGDLNTVLKADLTILDGSRVLTAGGPLGPGPVEELNCLIGGVDPVAVDAYGVERVSWYGRSVKPNEVGHLVACWKRGVGQIDLDRAEIVIRKVPFL